MSNSFEYVVQIFREKYKGPKIAWFIAGGGFSALDFRKFPGSSRLYHTSIEPYNEDTVNFLNLFANANIKDPGNFSFVNEEGTSLALTALENYTNKQDVFSHDLTYIVINSACSTDRYRKGSNRAYIHIKKNGFIYTHAFLMNKLSEKEYNLVASQGKVFIDEIRHEEDVRISQVALSLLMEDTSLMPDLEPGESLIFGNSKNHSN